MVLRCALILQSPNLRSSLAYIFNYTFTLFRDNLTTFGHIIEKEDRKYDYILTNPPYVTREARVIKEEIKSKKLVTIATLEKICNGFWIPEDIRFTVNVGAQVLQKI